MPVQNNCQNALFQTVRRTVFNSSGTYTKPENLAFAQFIAIGGGGGRQRVLLSTTDATRIGCGGAGGQTGIVLRSASSISASTVITIGAPGATLATGAPAGGATIVNFSTPAQVESGLAITPGIITVTGSAPPVTNPGSNGSTAVDASWQQLIRATSGSSVVGFNRWPNGGTDFRVIMYSGNGGSANNLTYNFGVVTSNLSGETSFTLNTVPNRGNGGVAQQVCIGTAGGSLPDSNGVIGTSGRVVITEFLRG